MDISSEINENNTYTWPLFSFYLIGKLGLLMLSKRGHYG